MRRYAPGLLFFILVGSTLAGSSSSDNWKLVSSHDAFWVKTVNADKHELLVAYHNNRPQFLLVLKTASPPPAKSLSVSISIDGGPKQPGKLSFLEKRPKQSMLQIDVDADEKHTYLSQMIDGLNLSIYFDFPGEKNKTISRKITFSLKGFTVALNDLLIANDIGSLDPAWLLRHQKDRELYCLMTTDISIEAIQYRLKGESYNSVLQLIHKTGYSIIDHNMRDIIKQVYNLPQKNLPYVPRAEKYLMFSNCMSHPFQ